MPSLPAAKRRIDNAISTHFNSSNAAVAKALFSASDLDWQCLLAAQKMDFVRQRPTRAANLALLRLLFRYCHSNRHTARSYEATRASLRSFRAHNLRLAPTVVEQRSQLARFSHSLARDSRRGLSRAHFHLWRRAGGRRIVENLPIVCSRLARQDNLFVAGASSQLSARRSDTLIARR